MSEINTKKILELMGLTSAPKMRALERMESYPVTGEESANDILNRELFGVPAKESAVEKKHAAARVSTAGEGCGKKGASESISWRVENGQIIFSESGKDIKRFSSKQAAERAGYDLGGWSSKDSEAMAGEGVKEEKRAEEAVSKRDDIDAIADNKKEKAKAAFIKKQDDADSDRDYHLNKDGMKTRQQEAKSAKESDEESDKYYSAEGSEGIVYADIKKIDDDAIVAHFDYFEEDFSEDKLEEIKKAMKELGYEIVSQLPTSDEEKADEAVAAESAKADEMLVETSVDAKFPENFNFDEEAFADEYQIDKETVTCIYKPEDAEAKIAEHIELAFTHDGKNVVLNIYADGRVDETVDAEEVDAQFTAEFEKKENEDGVEEDYLKLELIEDEEGDEGSDTVIKSEEDVITESEGDKEHKDEEGATVTPEFVEEAGLNLDPFYSKEHKMKVADKGVGVAPAAMANESLAAKIIRQAK